MSDIVYLRNAALSANVGLDCWHRNKPQPVLISLQLYTSVRLAGENDDVLETINYGTVYKAVAAAIDSSKWPNLESLAGEICRIGLETGGGKYVKASVCLPKALLQADGIGFECALRNAEGDNNILGDAESNILFATNLRLFCVIGVNKHEREDKQPLVMNLRFQGASEKGESDYQGRLKPIFEHVEKSIYLTLEALVISVAKLAIKDLGFSKVTVSAQKPSAYALMDCPGVEITRTREDFGESSQNARLAGNERSNGSLPAVSSNDDET